MRGGGPLFTLDMWSNEYGLVSESGFAITSIITWTRLKNLSNLSWVLGCVFRKVSLSVLYCGARHAVHFIVQLQAYYAVTNILCSLVLTSNPMAGDIWPALRNINRNPSSWNIAHMCQYIVVPAPGSDLWHHQTLLLLHHLPQLLQKSLPLLHPLPKQWLSPTKQKKKKYQLDPIFVSLG